MAAEQPLRPPLYNVFTNYRQPDPLSDITLRFCICIACLDKHSHLCHIHGASMLHITVTNTTIFLTRTYLHRYAPTHLLCVFMCMYTLRQSSMCYRQETAHETRKNTKLKLESVTAAKLPITTSKLARDNAILVYRLQLLQARLLRLSFFAFAWFVHDSSSENVNFAGKYPLTRTESVSVSDKNRIKSKN